LVHDVGYANVTTRGIARAAGVAEGTLYRHFPDKTALFFAAVLDRHGPILESVKSLPERAGHADVSTNLVDCLTRLAELRADLLPLELALLADPELSRQHPATNAATADPLPGPPEFVAAYLAAEQQLGRIRPGVDTNHAAVVLLAVLFGLAVVPAPVGNGVDSQLLDSAVRMLVDGIGPADTPGRAQ
jgi:AcrR family transcriptional regulator